ncbi:MAG: 5'/3'-nucleotidase SurE [Pseudomonadota bacterium]
MRILITNDDGINAPGLKVLEEIATEIAGEDGEVWTVAPAFEQSGVGHCISYTHPTMLSQFGPRRFAAEGSPADCVLAAVHQVMKDAPPDLVLSGVNRGNNAGENVLYSGTIGAAIEAALQGLPAIALSQFYGPENNALDNPFEASLLHGVDCVRRLLRHGLWDDSNYRLFYNVNFPPIPASAVKGTRITTQGWREDTQMGVEPHRSPSGRMFLWVKGGPQHAPTGPGTDVTANLDGYISVTPLRADMTAHDTIETLRDRIDT